MCLYDALWINGRNLKEFMRLYDVLPFGPSGIIYRLFWHVPKFPCDPSCCAMLCIAFGAVYRVLSSQAGAHPHAPKKTAINYSIISIAAKHNGRAANAATLIPLFRATSARLVYWHFINNKIASIHFIIGTHMQVSMARWQITIAGLIVNGHRHIYVYLHCTAHITTLCMHHISQICRYGVRIGMVLVHQPNCRVGNVVQLNLWGIWPGLGILPQTKIDTH